MRRAIICLSLLPSCAHSGGHAPSYTKDSRVNVTLTAVADGQAIVVDWPVCEEFDVTACGDKLKVTMLTIGPHTVTEDPDHPGQSLPGHGEGCVANADIKAATWSIVALNGIKPPVTYGIVPADIPGAGPQHNLANTAAIIAAWGRANCGQLFNVTLTVAGEGGVVRYLEGEVSVRP